MFNEPHILHILQSMNKHIPLLNVHTELMRNQVEKLAKIARNGDGENWREEGIIVIVLSVILSNNLLVSFV